MHMRACTGFLTYNLYMSVIASKLLVISDKEYFIQYLLITNEVNKLISFGSPYENEKGKKRTIANKLTKLPFTR